jgi:SEC-C motif domain protein|uniref:YchJ family protein n=1 Tax=Limnohabitans sp. TaxID=1907725 RepID=UPI004048E696
MAAPCPCGRTTPKGQALSLADCCGPLHTGQPAPDAERLMRSRYSAFVRGDVPHLLATWHSSQRPAELTLETADKWLGLEIKRHLVTGADTAEVEFVARFRVAGKAVRQHERSRFVREDGRWFYVDGDAL